MAYEPAANEHEIRFLEGIDVDNRNDPHYGEVEFEPLWARLLCQQPDPNESGDSPPTEMVVTRNRTALEIRNDCLPGSGLDPAIVAIQTIPFLAADPGDPNQLYLVYHDTDTDDPNDRDLNIYAHSLRRHPRGWCGWGTRARVNDDELAYDTDQFLPQATVDDNGGLHVTWYDDRDYEDQPDGPNSPNPKFDMYYAYSGNHGASFNPNIELTRDDPNSTEACLNYALFDEDPGFDFANRPGEYNGITAYGDEVWTCFTGTSWQELHDYPDHNPSVIWSSRIDLP